MSVESVTPVLLGLLCAGWAVAAGWAIAAAHGRVRRAQAALNQGQRLARMMDEAPALPLLVRADGRIEAPPLLAQWLGLDGVPHYLSELAPANAISVGARPSAEGGLTPAQLHELTEAVHRTQRTAAPFRLAAMPVGSRRSLAFKGHLADPQISPGGAALVWVFDASDTEAEIARLRDEAAQVRGDFAALVGLIEAAPMPMWFRAPDGGLRLVNSSYVRAVGGASAEEVIAAGTELVEWSEGRSPAEVALAAAAAGKPVERIVTATIAGISAVGTAGADIAEAQAGGGSRRTLRVSDLPLGERGIAGYAIDIEDMEEIARAFRAFREAQRSMLDQLSSGVAQFDTHRRMLFANEPFLRLFALSPTALHERPPFERVLDLARDGGRVPETRDFPAWRRERTEWFAASGAQEEAWPLSDGSHLRILAQPMPDGGMLLIIEDRTETLRISAMRDTLLRTRTAIFDSLFEAVAIFAPDGKLQLWNRRFAAAWGLAAEFVDTHPRVDRLLERIGARLAHVEQAEEVGDVIRAATLERRQTAGRVQLADGRTLACAGVPLPDGNGLLTVLDITDSQKAEEALRERNAALVEADMMKTRFLANMSYEFRTPLTSIGGFAELLRDGLGGALSGTGQDYVAAILASVARLGEQIENVLELSQSEAGMLPLAMEEVELLPFITALVEERAEILRVRKLTLDLRGDHSAGRVAADRRRLARALGHLVDNAIAATPPDGHIRVELSRRQVRPGAPARIIISDNGPGMDAGTLARALDAVRLSADGQALERRAGLGLPLARQLIEAHGGRLELSSRPRQGTTAIVELPPLPASLPNGKD